MSTQAESAEKRATSALPLRRAGVDPAGLPPADEIVRACLDALPAGPDEVAVLDDRRDLRRLDITQMRQSRQAKALVNEAQWHLDEVQNAHLAARLREWIAIKPRLVQRQSNAQFALACADLGATARQSRSLVVSGRSRLGPHAYVVLTSGSSGGFSHRID